MPLRRLPRTPLSYRAASRRRKRRFLWTVLRKFLCGLRVLHFVEPCVQTASTVFERRMVRTGLQAGGNVEILSDVAADEPVVFSGAYLLESEREVRRGGGSMADMKM